jgi:hypothetical protein
VKDYANDLQASLFLEPLSSIPLSGNLFSIIPYSLIYDSRVCSYPFWIIRGRTTLLS